VKTDEGIRTCPPLKLSFDLSYFCSWQGHRSIYCHTHNTSYLPNGKAYELQTSYAGRGQSPASLATTMTSRIKGQGHMVCLTRPAHNSRTNSRRIIKIGSKVAHDMSNIAAMLLHTGGAYRDGRTRRPHLLLDVGRCCNLYCLSPSDALTGLVIRKTPSRWDK